MSAVPAFVGSIGRTFRTAPRDPFRPPRRYAAGHGLFAFRENSRTPVSLPVEVRLPGWAAARMLWAEIGPQGFFVPIADPPGVGTFVRFRIPAVELAGLGEVVWIRVRPTTDRPVGMGIELGTLDRETRAALALLLSQPS